jgi:hypothetical protein
MNCNFKARFVALAVATVFAGLSSAASAEEGESFFGRNVEQQRRIEEGLRSGDLTTREAARLEAEQSRVERFEARALRDGTVSAEERRRIDAAQDRVSRDIARERHDEQRGDPNSPSSRRMQADVERNVNQQRRIAQGVRSGELTNREAAHAEWGQSRVNRAEARAGADGWIGRGEQQRIQGFENRQGRQIARDSHDGQVRGERWTSGRDERWSMGRGERWSSGRGEEHANAHSSWGDGRHSDNRGGRWDGARGQRGAEAVSSGTGNNSVGSGRVQRSSFNSGGGQRGGHGR